MTSRLRHEDFGFVAPAWMRAEIEATRYANKILLTHEQKHGGPIEQCGKRGCAKRHAGIVRMLFAPRSTPDRTKGGQE